MSKEPAMRGGGTAGEPLRAVARSILSEARASLEDAARSEAVAVHDFRRAMKRWRALLRLLEPYLGESGRNLRLGARDLARELSRPRDAQSALDAIDDTFKHDKSFPPATLRTIRTRVDDARKMAESTVLTPDMRTRMLAYLRRASRAVDRWPVARIGFSDIAQRVTETYRRARRILPNDWPKTGAEELHELRRRVIEHRYQMELVEPLWPRPGKLWIEEAQRLRDRLGRYQDLSVLAGMTAPHQLLARWRSKLGPLIAERQSVHLAAASRLSGRLFAERPKAFRRRLQAMWKARPRAGGERVPPAA
jgi:CHAD domain-containing protein